MKKIILFLSILLCLALLVSCGQAEPVYTAEDVAGKVYTYEKPGFGGPFTINVFEDGTFQYYVGFLSSYIGFGTWSVEDGVLILTDNTGLGYQNLFCIGENELIFLGDGSTNFMYLAVAEGDRFFGEPMETEASSWYNGSKKTKYLVSLYEVRQLLIQNQQSNVDRVMELLEGFTHDDLVQFWGEPDGMTSGIWSYAWELDETSAIWVVFDSEGYVSEVHLNLKD